VLFFQHRADAGFDFVQPGFWRMSEVLGNLSPSRSSGGFAGSVWSRIRRNGREAGDGARARFRPVRGQAVEVRPAADILATLDADFGLEGLPFMPEMLKYCGRRMTVARRVDRTCVEGYGLRAMRDTVLLNDSHCDGAAHDGCQRKCLAFWKEAWLRPVDPADAPAPPACDPSLDGSYQELAARTRDGERYACQSTRLRDATQALSKLNLVNYFREIADGELAVGKFLRIVAMTLGNRLRALFGLPRIGSLRGAGGSHSKGDLDLRAGEFVRVKSAEEISRTVGPTGRNRGLLFEPDMNAYVGGIFEVDYRIDRMISEETGKMVRLTNTVALKNVHCEGLCAKNCPRGQPHFWREAWVERIGAAGQAPARDASA
jgi:hypothetical protein